MIRDCYPVAGGDFLAAGSASRRLKEQLKLLGVDGQIMRRIMIASYEAEMNVVIHAARGNIWIGLDRGLFNMEVVDQGPGIADVELAMKPGFSTASAQARQLGFGAGMGLPNIKKASDVFEVDSRVGKGTRVRSTIYLKAQAAGRPLDHCLSIREGLCNGCLDCLKACPTRAVRVWNGRPSILEQLCIQCAACMAACKRGVFGMHAGGEPSAPGGEPPAPGGELSSPGVPDTLVIPRAFLTQFGPRIPPRAALAALRSLGFKDIRFTEEWEEELRRAVRKYAGQRDLFPVISPICPAVNHLIESQFPALVPHIAPFLTPIEAAVQACSLLPAAFVPACPGQHALLEGTDLSGRLKTLHSAELSACVFPAAAARAEAARTEARTSVQPAQSQDPAVLEAWGMENVLEILERTEKGLAGEFRVLELSACAHGCYGSPLFEENPFAAKKRWSASRLGRRRQVSAPLAGRAYPARPGVRLDADMGRAIEKLARIDELAAGLPGRNCGACGAPSCSSLAEDIVLERSPGLRCAFTGGSQS